MPKLTCPSVTYRARLSLTLLGVLASSAAIAQAPVYQLDPVHTRVLLMVDHAGFSKAMGTVSGSHGQVQFDPADWSVARVDVRIPLTGLDFGDARWNRTMQGRTWLDTARYAEAHFRAEGGTPAGEAQAQVCGTLTLRGVAAPVCLQVQFNQLRRHPLPPFARTIGFSATGQLSRSAFGMRAWSSLVGDTVQLRIEVEATQGGQMQDNALILAPTSETDADEDDALQRAADALLEPTTEPTP